MQRLTRFLRRALLLALCLCVTAAPAWAEGFRFTLRADIDPVQYSSALRPLLTGLAALADVSALEGEVVAADGSFDLTAALRISGGRSECVTDVHVYGLDSHWGVESSLLGDQALMINVSALLPFGLKAQDYMSLPLDTAALLIPYTHVHALTAAGELLAPLFPSEAGSVTLTRAEVDQMIQALQALCEEDAALNHWLEATGLYPTVTRCFQDYFSLPEAQLTALTIERSEAGLTWTADGLTLLSLMRQENTTSFTLSLPTAADVSATIRDDHTFVTGSMHVDAGDTRADLSFSLPTALPCALPAFYLTLDAESPILPESGLHLFFEGESRGNTLTIRQLRPDHSYTMMTLSATLTPFVPEKLPAYAPEALTGVNVLSVTSDSLSELLHSIREPLLTGAFDLLVAAPPSAVQAMMDVLEDAGVIDLVTDSLSGD